MRTWMLAGALLWCGVGCATSGGTAKPTKSLYERLGGKDAITAAVGELLTQIAADGRINMRFANTDMPHLKQMLIEQICEASGGPCKYTGKDMKTSHTGQNVSNEEFDAMVDDLKAALVKLKVPTREANELVAAIAPTRGDIVGK